MEKETSKESIARELAAKQEQIKQRIDGLENEISSTPAAIKSAVSKNPWLGVGAAVAAGAVVGLIFGGRKKKSSLPPAHQALVENYIGAISEEVRRRVRRGKDPEEAVRASLRDRAPVIIYAPDTDVDRGGESRGFLRQVGDLTLKTALGFAVKTAIDFFTASLNVKELQNMLALEEEERRSAAEADPAPIGDGAREPASFEKGTLDE